MREGAGASAGADSGGRKGGRWLAATSVDLDAESDHDDVNEEGESADGCGDRETFIEAADSASE